MNKNVKYRVLGIMSGTSLDGIDLAITTFFKKNKSWDFNIEKCKTIEYSKYWQSTLASLHHKEDKIIKKVDKEFGEYIAQITNNFLGNEKIDFISCHGHTIFHEPKKKITLQIGDGKYIAKLCKITTINNFRTLDVSLNGQGAPLVPIGDLYLFNQYKYCVNLGGFSNISIKKDNLITAFDICPVNIVLNEVCKKLNIEYDSNGEIARKGMIIIPLLKKLNQLNYYNKKPPKSLSREWVEKNIYHLINNYKPKDVLCTFCEHIAIQIGKHLKCESALFTGGGVFNKYLIERINLYSSSKIIVPDNKLINFKEALIFGFLGVLRFRNEINCLRSVTGAKKDNCGGIIHEF